MSGLGQFAPLLPLAMLVSLVVVGLRRRSAKKKRFEDKNGRT